MTHPNDDLQKSDMDYLRIAADAGDVLAKAVLLVEQADLLLHRHWPNATSSDDLRDKVYETYRALQNEWMRRNGR